MANFIASENNPLFARINRNHLHKVPYKLASAAWYVFRIALLVGLCFVLLYPLIYMLSAAFKPIEQVYDPSVIWVPKSYTLENFKNVLKIMNYKSVFITSARICIISTLLQLISCSLAGYGFARFNFKFKGVFFALMIFSILIPPQLVMIPSYLRFKNFDFLGIGWVIGLFSGKTLTTNLLNSEWTFYLPALFGVGLKSGLFIYLFCQYFRGLPKELEDAASIDGCGFLSCFLRIAIPNAITILIIAVILSVVWYWNDYLNASMYFTSLKTVTTALIDLKSDLISASNYSQTNPYLFITRIQAGCLLTIAPVMIFYIALQRKFVEGIERSGIVG
jgi:multiple sugar transport system permease protein